MKFDYTSDLHLDIHIKHDTYNQYRFQIFKKYFENKQSDNLIIAGDLGHDILQNIDFFKFLQNDIGYKEIFTVEGNHSGYMIKNNDINFKNGLEKISYAKKLYKNIGIKILDGNSYELKDSDNKIITIGGCDSWYDGSFYKLYQYNQHVEISNKDILRFWKMSLNDSSYIEIDDFFPLFEEEKEKLLNLQNKCDIIVTHVKPLNKKEYFSGKYKNDLSNAFFCFDWEENIINDEKLKIWVYGHTHEIENFDFHGKKFLCNPYGYPAEINDKKYLRTIEI
jgi:predicted phosphodiesterase